MSTHYLALHANRFSDRPEELAKWLKVIEKVNGLLSRGEAVLFCPSELKSPVERSDDNVDLAPKFAGSEKPLVPTPAEDDRGLSVAYGLACGPLAEKKPGYGAVERGDCTELRVWCSGKGR